MNWGVFVLFVSLAVFFIIRMPISFAMLASCIIYFLVAAPAALGNVYTVITGNMIAGFTMLAAPLFVFMANVLNEGEVTDKMFDFCNGLLGRMKGGTAQVNVFISLIFSGMTGSAIADASGIGLMEIEQMKKEGYDPEFSCAITAASATVVLLLGGIYSGVCTPTEAGALASAYALLIGFLVYRSLGWKKLLTILKKTAANTATLALLCGTAYLFSFIVSREKVPAAVGAFVTGITTNKYVFLFVVNIVFLLLGCVLDVSTIQLVFVPMVLPLVKSFGIDLVHFGVVICLNMMIGLSTPPFGMLLFIVAGLGKTKMAGVIKEILPMVLIMIGLLFAVTYIPDLIMFIPNHMMG